MNVNTLILFLFISFGVTSQINLKKNSYLYKKHSVKKLQKDIDFTFKKIVKLHPNLYQYISIEELNRKVDSVKESLTKPLSSEEFFFILTPLINEIKQGHNSVFFPVKQDVFGLPMYPKELTLLDCLEFESIEEYVIISKANCNTNSPLINSKLIAIQGKPTSYYIDKYSLMFHGDGYNSTFKKRMPGMMIKNLIYLEHQDLDSITLTLSLNGSILDTVFYKHSYYQFVDDYDPDFDDGSHLLNQELNEMLDFKDSIIDHLIHHEFTDTSKETALLTIKEFKASSFDKYDSCFRDLDSFCTKNLIIDLRNNLGGSLDEIHYLTRYLEKKKFLFIKKIETLTRIPVTRSIWRTDEEGGAFAVKLAISPLIMLFEQLNIAKKQDQLTAHHVGSSYSKPQEKAFQGSVYVLINGNSFSASSILAAYLQGAERAVIVGEESGGAFNGCVAGIQKFITLPNSKLVISFGMLQVKTPYTQSPDGYGVIPDFTVLPELSHREKGIDTELEFVLHQIKTDTQKTSSQEE